jgi:NhaP-type Na+/H+ or K+/H+ antiporter
MNDEEFEDKPDPKIKRYIGMKSIMDMGMGIIYIGVGLFILFAGKLNFHNEFTESIVGKCFAGMVIIYGVWRLYRGIKKDYFVER